MIGALIYLQAQSFKNLLLTRLRRLRRPKYLIGALFGVLYFGAIFLRPLLMANRNANVGTFFSAVPTDVLEFLAALALLVGVIVSWVLPHNRSGLIFTEAEIAFLFPAPVSRATLIRYKLLKSQISILITVGFLTLLSLRYGPPQAAARRAVGMWLVLSLISLHSLGVAFAQLFVLGRGGATWKRRAAFLLVLLGAIAGAAFWAGSSVPALQAADLRSMATVVEYLRHVAGAAPAAVLLAPFRAVVRPFLAADNRAFFLALGPVVALLIAHYFWVVRTEVAFEESSIEASRRHAARVTRMRGGNRWAVRPARKARPPFPLGARGPAAVAILWKNLISAGQAFTLRLWLPLGAYGLYMGYVFNQHAHESAWLTVIATAAAILAGMSVLVGPQIFRQDFRQDMAAIDLLKSYPVTGRQIALGEILAPLVILTAFQWTLLAIAGALFGNGRGIAEGPVEYGACFALIAPALNLIMLLLPNAAALLYPGWFNAAQTAGRDLEVMGQRLVLTVALVAVFLLTMAPAAVAFSIIYLIVAPLLMPAAAALPAATAITALVLTAEGVAGLAVLGYLYERFDPSAEIA